MSAIILEQSLEQIMCFSNTITAYAANVAVAAGVLLLLRHRFNCHLNTITAHAAVAAVAVASVLPPHFCYRLLLPMLPSQWA